MRAPDIDYAALFAGTPSPYLVLTPGLVIAEVNRAYAQATGRAREDLLGRYLFDAFPDNPADPDADGVRNLHASLRRVLATKERDSMALQKYDIPVASSPGMFQERWWSPINTPVLGPDGTVVWIIHRVEDVTAFVHARGAGRPQQAGPGQERHERAMEAELYVRARELQILNEQLRRAHAREREVALALQRAMLPPPALVRDPDVAVRYLPAAGSLNVCGDWYDLADLPGNRLAVAVGDVVGHGLEAACVMGQLRSALSAAVRAADGPAQALDILGLYARSVDGALATTAAQAVIDRGTRTVTYSCAGHPPPMLRRTDGTVEVLDRATDPPLGARPDPVPRPQARTAYTAGATLVLYTDGLIERRGEDIDAGLNRLADSLTRRRRRDPEPLADALLADLGLPAAADDTALVVIRL